MKKIISTLIISCTFTFADAQYATNTQLTAEQLVQEIFQGTGVSISNVTINGLDGTTMSDMMGMYEYEGTLPIPPAGIILCTGMVGEGWGGSNFTGEPDLEVLSGQPIYDAMVLEFDFIPEEDTMIFEYVFGSGEYFSFTCSPFNDVFGFFLSGPDINGPYQNNAINIALIPATQIPVSINTVNSGTSSYLDNDMYCESADPDWQSNSIYFVPDSTSSVEEFNGMTVVLQASWVVIPGASYHIKLAIGDASDSVLDSGVFLQAASFRSVSGIPTSVRDRSGSNDLHAWFSPAGDLHLDGKDAQVRMVRLYDLHGRLLIEQELDTKGRSVIAGIDVPVGAYVVEAMSADQWHRVKVVRQ